MADNVDLAALTGDCAADEVTYSGDTAVVQLVRPVLVTGSEGSKTVVDLPGDNTNGLIVNLGANNDVTITGTVAVTQSGTWDEVGINDSGNSITVDWAGTAPPIGAGVESTALRVTLATDSTGVISVDDNNASLSVDWNGTQPVTGSGNATGALRVELANNGTGLVGLNAGTNTIGKLAANSGVDIGDVDIVSIIPGTGATNLGKAEDGGHTTGDVGVMALGVRNDADAALSSTDLDYTPLSTTSSGSLNVVNRPGVKRVSVQSAGLTTSVTSYAAGDQVGTQFTIAGAARASGGGGYIVGVSLIDASDVIGAFDVVFSNQSITPASDNAAFAISDADALNTIQLVPLAGAYDLGNNRIAQAQNIRIPYDCSGGTSIYANLITRSAHTFFGATTALQLIVYLELS